MYPRFHLSYFCKFVYILHSRHLPCYLFYISIQRNAHGDRLVYFVATYTSVFMNDFSCNYCFPMVALMNRNMWKKVVYNNKSRKINSECVSLGAFEKLRKATISFVVSVHRHGTTWPSLGGFWFNLIFELFFFFQNSVEKKFHQCLTRITVTLHVDVFTVMTIPSWLLLKTRNVKYKTCR